MTQSQDAPTLDAPVADGSMIQTLTISVDRALSSHDVFQPYQSADKGPAHLDTLWQLDIIPEYEESEGSTKSYGTLVPAQLLLAWAIVVKSHAGVDSVVVLGPNVQEQPQSSLVIDEAMSVSDYLKAIRSRLDGSVTSKPATTTVVGQSHRYPLALRYSHSQGATLVENQVGLPVEDDRDGPVPANTPLSITCSGHLGRWSVEFSGDSSVIQQSLLRSLSRHFLSAFSQLCSFANVSSGITLGSISLGATEDTLARIESTDDSFNQDLNDVGSSASTVGEAPTMTRAGSILSVPMAASACQTSASTEPSSEEVDERFALLSLSREKLSKLEALLHTSGPVEDCYPCCPSQEGILVSQMKDSGTYNILVIWDLVAGADPATTSDVSLQCLRTAWERVVKRHASLRSTFVESLRDGGLFDQVVLSSPSVDVIEVPWLEGAFDEDELLQSKAASWERGKPQHRLGLCKAIDGRLRLRLLISNAVIDGPSLQTIGRDLELSLNEVLPDSRPPDLQRRYVGQLQKKTKEDAREFWRAHLDGLYGCLFPRLIDWTKPQSPAQVSVMRRTIPDVKRLRHICHNKGIAMFNLIQAAWAMVLRAYTLSDDVCFAFMATNRYLVGDDADDSVGFFINLMLCRARLQASTPIADVLTTMQRDFASSLPYQQYSLAEIAHDKHIPISQFYNTSMSFYSVSDNAESHGDQIQVRQVALYDVTEDDIVVRVYDAGEENMTVEFSYRGTTLSDAQAENVLSAFLATINNIPRSTTVDDVELMDERMTRQVLQWNERLPVHVNACTHELIHDMAMQYPDAPAIESHDGTFTYGEFDRMTSKVAAHLVSLNVGPEVPVVFRMEKSFWAVVAIVGILRAGGVFVPLDTAWPVNRAQFIIDNVGTSILLTIEATPAVPLERVKHTVVLSTEFLDTISVPASAEASLSSQVHPSNAAYILFTSGSTGQPKGVVVEHRTISTSSRAHGEAMFMDRQSRVFQFSSYTFDASVCEIITTLVHGGCICIPSADDRLSNLSAAISKFRSNWIFMTPTTLSTFHPLDCPSVKTVVLGGEPLTQAVKDAWAPYVRLIQAYGPTETCIYAVCGDLTDPAVPPSVIGHPIGSRCWIVRPGNPQALVPIGALGELLIEGPIVARGYFNDPVRTNDVYIDDVPSSWATPSPHRIYCSGDLVRYNMDGSLTFVGRRDGQLKVRGQRCEVGEIENHLTVIEPDIAHCAVLLPKEGPCASRLVAVLSFKTAHPVLSMIGPGTGDLQLLDIEHISSTMANLQDKLAEQVPIYMVPQIWLPVVSLPSTTACKTDRRRVAQWVDHISPGTLDKVLSISTTQSGSFSVNRSPVQAIIATAWGEALGVAPESIPDDRSFFSLGGDSILAMLVMNRCRARGAELSARDILRGLNITEIASRVSISDKDSALLRDLTPAQSLALGTGLDLPSLPRESRTVQLQLVGPVDRQVLEDAVRMLVDLHPALRTTYVNDGAAWLQRVGADLTKTLLFAVHEGNTNSGTSSEPASLLGKSRAQLDAATGPLLAVDYFANTNRVALSALNIALDLPSWEIVLRDLDCLLSGSPVTTRDTSTTEPQSCPLPASEPLEGGADLGYWELEPAETYLPHETTYALRLDSDASEVLHKTCLQADLSLVDILIAAAAQSFSEIFADRGVPVIHVADNAQHDVGYCDSVYPVQFPGDLTATGAADVVSHVKNSRLEAITNGFSSYMAQSYTPKVLATQIPEILVRHFDTRESIFQGRMLQQLDSAAASTESPVATLIPSCISITACVHPDNSVDVIVAHSWDLGRQKHVRKWVRLLEAALSDNIRSIARANSYISRADFPLICVPDDIAWERLRSTIAAALGSSSSQTIEDLHLCSPVQQGMLLSQAKSTSSYQMDIVWKIYDSSGASKISPERLEKAWRKVVRRHAALRTAFVDGTAVNVAFIAVILRNPPTVVQHQTLVDGAGIEALLASQPPLGVASHEPTHRLTIAETRAQDQVLVHLRISHAVVDGVSMDVLRRDLARAYAAKDGSTDGRSASDHAFRDYVSYAKTQDTESSLAFWTKRLSTVSPCRFPQLQVPDVAVADETRIFTAKINDTSSLLKFCQVNSLSVSNLVQVAWALVLRAYTNSHHVCFGYMVSGRDAPVRGIETGVGVFINLLVSDFVLADDTTIREALEAARAGLADSIDHQYCPLIQIQSALHLGSEPFFNTGLSCYRQDEATLPSVAGLAIDELLSSDTTEFAIAAKTAYTRSAMELSLTYRTDAISPEAADVVGNVWLRTLESLPSLLDEKVSSINLMDPQSSHLVRTWNKHVPGPINACLHDIISRNAALQPDKEALYSTMGSLTYCELDDYSTRLGHHLVSLGIVPESVVPLLFEKSIWAVVAMLGVLKAGGAFVALDPAHPADRLALIISDTSSPVLLVSDTQAARPLITEALANVVMLPWTVMPASILALPVLEGRPCSTVTPENAAYLTYTSGSTGKPKGVVIEHRAVSTGTKEHGPRMGYTDTSRVLQFASYAWDASIGEVFTTLVHHGCVCIASETERIEDLTGFMNRSGVTWAVLTPAVARMMTPADVPTLRTLACGGEPLGDLTPRIWSEKVKFLQAYGPAEACVCASMSDRQGRQVRPALIGHMMGSAAWIVNPSNADLLVPVGAVGELLIEGPILGRGYRNDHEKTDAAFMSDLKWSIDYPRHEHGRRLYKTGDLVRYNLDGSMDFVQRKDTQIKIRGQRVEAGEIESYITRAHKDVQHVYVTFTKQGRLSSRLVAVLSFRDLGSAPVQESSGSLRLLQGADCAKAKELLRTITEYLSSKLPRHMIPVVWAVVQGSSVPLTTSGKIDRRQMTTWIERAGEGLVREILALNDEDPVPDDSMSPTEAILRSIWALVLNLEPYKISRNRPFFSLGGDSITAMQVVSHCRSQGIDLTVKDIFTHKTIAALATFVGYVGAVDGPSALSKKQTLDLSEQVDVNFSLSPIQQMYFDLYPDGTNHFNQSFLVQIPPDRKLASPIVHAALQQLVSRHSILRARYTNSQGRWVQRITDSVAGSLTYQEHTNVTLDGVDALLDSAQVSLDINNGPILSAKLIHLANRQILAMVAHHLVVDLVSWRVLLEELEAILSRKTHPLANLTPIPFQAWVRVQSSRVQKWCASEVLPYDIPEPQLDYWGLDAEKANPFGSTHEMSFELDEAITKALLGPCNEPLQTDPQDLFLTAAFQSFAQVFPDRTLPAIYIEGHGREADTADRIDLSRTVGWFTSIVPVALANGVPPDLIEALIRIKDARRSVPGHGVPYFAYRYLSDDGAQKFRHHSPMEILFNYYGQYQQLERDGALLQPVVEGEFAQRDVDPSVPRLAVFDIAVAVAMGRATVSLAMPQSLTTARAHGVSAWMERFEQLLTSLVNITSSIQPSFTLSDMPLIKDISYAHLAEMEAVCLEYTGTWGPATIEEIFPCSPMQQGILLSQSRTPDLYDVRVAFEVALGDRTPEVRRLEEAWRQVVKRQPMLRTVFLPNLRGSGSFDQAVLRDPPTTVRHIQQKELPESSDDVVGRVRQAMAEAPASSFEYGKLPHELVIYTAGNRVFILLRLSHAVVDGASLPYVMQDLQHAYAQRLPAAPGIGYKELVAFIQQQPVDQALKYWSEYLKDSSPCRLPPFLDDTEIPSPSKLETQEMVVPNSESLRRLCTEHGITMASIFHAAWALVLRAYTGEDELHFGYLASGRDAPIEGVASLLGPLVNMLICRVKFDRSKSVAQVLQEIHDDFASGISNQYISLAEVQHDLNLGSEQLFTSFVSFQRHDPAKGATEDIGDSLKMMPIDGRDPTEYDLSLNILDTDQNLSISFTHWTSKVSPAHASHMMRALLAALTSFAENSGQSIINVNLVSAETRHEMDAWNNISMPVPLRECVHNLIERQVQEIPDHPAVCGWDRDFTYRELDEAANAFAYHIHSLGDFKPDTFVITCFDKSAWVVVSQVAILKAGGGFVAVDPTHPIDRIQSIISELGSPRIMLTESKYRDRFEGLFPNIVVIDQEQLDSVGPRPDAPSTEVNPDNVAYAIFTSGSTGKPKGILIEHQSLATATTLHASRFRIDRNSRSLQFAAYTFDVSIGETFYTLVNGGSVCVPSEHRRLEDLAGVINDFKVNWALLTPTIADILDPTLVPGLNTLVLGGEAATADNIRRWNEKVFLIITYGPTETTIWCNATGRLTATSDPANFGPAMGAGIWVVDMNDPSVLLPIGAMGELIVEGPLVGRGYIDPIKTADAFIDPPAWLTAPYPGKQVYRSGDIVRYNPDGTCSFVRRRDNQVKVRGQRIELNEVEIHISQADQDLRHAVVLYPKTGPCQGRLTVVLSYRLNDAQDQEAIVLRRLAAIGNNKETTARNAAVRSKLSSTLPGYMIPKIWITVEQLPFTTHGKMDRRQILDWVQALTENDLASIVGQGLSTTEIPTSPEGAKTPMERQLVSVWSQVLNVPVRSLPLDQSFTNLGGDSISAMQVVSRARECGVTVTVHDILRAQSLTDLAGRARFKALAPSGDKAQSLSVVTEEPFALLPIQRMFFRMHRSGNSHVNQTFIVRLSKSFAAEEVEMAIAAVVKQHPMLRARFLEDSGQWTQQISPDVKGSFNFQQHSFLHLPDALAVLNQLQRSLDIRQGPLVTSCLLNLPDGQVLFLAAHHLVVDLISWRIILADLEVLLSAGSGSSSITPETVSVPVWMDALLQQATEYRVDSVLPFAVPPADFDFWDMGHMRRNVVADTVTIQVRLDAGSTTAVLGRANAAFGTDPDDLMIAALAFSFRSVFPSRLVPTIYAEAHGRNSWDDSIDLSRTVGWFTTIYPLVVPEQNTAALDLIQTVRQVKDMRHSIPSKGLPYFASQYLTEEGRTAFEDHFAMEILFNYLGQYQQLQQSNTIIQELRGMPLDTEDTAPTAPRMALIDVVAAVEGSELVLSLGYNAGVRHRDRFQIWLDEYRAALQRLSEQLPAIPPSFTPGDFPLLGLDDSSLLSLAAACEAKVGSWDPTVVESAYPCSPLQQGILVSQSKDPNAYVVHGVWKIRPTRGTPFRMEDLQNAWRRVVRYHPVLRTVFCQSGRTDGIFAQVVLREASDAATPIIKVIDHEGADPVEFLRSSAPSLPSGKPPHVLVICASGSETYMSLQVSHTLIDGTSMGLLIDDLLRAYNSTLDGYGPAYSHYISHVYSKPMAHSLSYWSHTLASTRPCLFPVLSNGDNGRLLHTITRVVPGANVMRTLGRKYGVTISNLFQLAWALVLRAFTGSDSVCFGYLTSGRDVPVDRIEEIVGPLISMLISTTSFGAGDDAQSALELLQSMNHSYIESLPHQHCSLADIQHALGVSNTGLFNTAMSLQQVAIEEETPGRLTFDHVYTHDPSEYNMTLNILDSSKSIQLHFTYWTDTLSDSYASDVVDATLRALDAIVQDPHRILPCVDLLSNNSRRCIMDWNSEEYPPIESTVHGLIEARVEEIPDHCAVASWEGELSYAELDRCATRLAVHLRGLGVGPEVTVPFCFKKSIWTVVAMLAVMKAGGVFVPLDPAHPTERILTIVEQLPSRIVILTSPDCAEAFSHLFNNTIVVNAASIAQLESQEGACALQLSPAATPDNSVYIIFTSGSTGRPKGVVLEHRAVSTGTTAHGHHLSFDRDSRVLQFSSYIFDGCIMEIFTTLVHGGCICVLSEEERMSNLAAAINRLRINWIFLTPAVASILDPSEVPTVRLIAIGGERPVHAVVEKWNTATCQVVQIYGPTECCVLCTFDCRRGLAPRPEVIGKGVGCQTWVVDHRDPNILMPVGAVGELLISGPIVARGYLNDPDKTRDAFFSGLSWLPEGRFYRTGDLVSYRPEGKGNKLNFIRRKDTQVKVRGQRIELGDISYHIGGAHDKIATRAVVLGSRGRFAGKVVAILAFRDLGIDQDQNKPLQLLEKREDQIKSKTMVSEIQNFIGDKLPSYMHPSVMIVVNNMPTNTSGKIEDRRVAAWVDNMTDEIYDRIMSFTEADEDCLPTGEVGKIIHEVIAEVVNLPLQQVSVHRSFISLGGDSITAMQVMALCRQRGVSLSVQDILKSVTITAMLTKANSLGSVRVPAHTNAQTPSEEDEFDPFPLSPIQELHFTQFPDGENHYNQSMLLKLQRPTPVAVIHKALLELVLRHPMLRAHFQKNLTDGRWTQTISPNPGECLSYSNSSVSTWEEAQSIMLEAERCLNITTGPMLAARLIHVPDFTSLFLVAHHLVIDLVSWRILLRDLEQLIDGTPLPKTQTSWSYQQWVRSLQSYVETQASTALALPFAISEPDLGFWEMDASSNDFTNLVQGNFTLDPSLTDILLRAADKTLKAEVLDVLLAMATHTFGAVFSDRATPLFHTESHGRVHPEDPTVPVHETVGWFTAIVPLLLAAHGNNYIDSVIRAKDIRRAVPGLGVPYFTAKVIRESEKIPVEILFNYLGRFQQLERSDGLFELLPKSMGPTDVSLTAARLSVIDISAVVEKNTLTVSWNYDAGIQHQGRLTKWFALYEKALIEVTSALQKACSQLTRSDVPLLPISHGQLRPLNEALAAVSRNGAEGVEDVYPTSPMQRGILLSQSKNSSHYDVHAVWEITPSKGYGGQVDVSRLQRAWHRVVQRHPMLRTVFISGLHDDTPFDQVVLKKFHPSITYFTYDNEEDKDSAMEELWDSASGSFDLDVPAHRLALCAGPDGKVYAHFQVSHALVDATSLEILVRDWNHAYASDVPASAGTPYSRYITHIQKTSLDASLLFWAGQLEAVTACRLPRQTDGVIPVDKREMRHLYIEVPFGARLGALARQLNISVASIFQLAWALVLRSYTNLQDICFGYISSGRDVELDGILDAVGPFINILVSRVVFTKDATVSAILQKLFGTYLDSLPHQHASLADIMHSLKMPSGQLFNTAMSFQKLSTSSTAGKSQDLPISFAPIRGADPTEFDAGLNVVERDTIDFSIHYWNSFLSDAQANNLAQSLLQALRAIEATPDHVVDSLHLLPTEHMAQIKRWGDRLPPPVDRTIHDLFDDICLSQPTAPAVHAWDGRFTYAELDNASSRLAGLLLQQGVKANTFVAMFFEKTVWVPVAFLAILKAGAAFLLLDPEAPGERLQNMMEQTKTSIILCSSTYSATITGWDKRSIVVSKDIVSALPAFSGRFPNIPSSSAAYIIFTSGTTGTPKGAVIEHGAYCCSALAQAQIMSISPESRCLQFASFMFDASMAEMVTPLLVGGCVCMPRRQDMVSDLPRVMKEMDINWAVLTCSFGRTISPETVPTLKTLFLGGEPMSQRDIDIWADRVHLGAVYGPSECSAMASGLSRVTRSTEPSNIGYPSGCAHWVTEPANMHRLVPIGAIGELLLEGPTLSRGYINNPTKTAEAFASGLAWAPQMGRSLETRFYATGDLVSLNSDGSVTFIGRKDSQVKIHGQRIELGEIQHHMTTIDEIQQSIVVCPSEGRLRKRLVAVLELKDFSSTTTAAAHGDMLLIPSSMRPRAAETIRRIRDVLTQRVPSYMVPSIWVVLQNIPTMISGKLHIPAVQAWVQSIDDETYREIYASEPVSELDPSEKVALQISRKLSTLLVGNDPGGAHKPEDFVGKDIVPIERGLDSISAITLSAWVRKTFGVTVSMATFLSPETSIRMIAALVGEKKAESSGLTMEEEENPGLIYEAGDGPDPLHCAHTPLVLIHDGSGRCFSYYCLNPIGRPVYEIHNPHFYSAKPWPGGISEMASYYVELMRKAIPHGRILLGGWSLGGLLSLEMARLLVGDPDFTVIGIIMVDSTCPVANKTTIGEAKQAVTPYKQQFGLNIKQETIEGVERCFVEAWNLVEIWAMPRWDGSDFKDGRRAQKGTQGEDSGQDQEAPYVLSPSIECPPVILLRARDAVPTELGQVDTTRESRSLGWDKYQMDFLKEIVDIPGHHFSVFALDHVNEVSQKLKDVCNTFEKMAASTG